MRFKSKFKLFLKIILISIVVVAFSFAIYFIVKRFEKKSPLVETSLHSSYLGVSQNLSFIVKDKESGIKSIFVSLIQNNIEKVLIDEKLPSGGFARRGYVLSKRFQSNVTPLNYGMKDGEAVLKIVIFDYSWSSWFRGNATYIEKKVKIDTRPPYVQVLTKSHSISRGGTGLVIYKVSEDDTVGGVYINSKFFPAYPGYFKDERIFFSFFALNFKKEDGDNIFIEVSDSAGNKTRKGFPYYIYENKTKNDELFITDSFLQWKLPEYNLDKYDKPKDTLLERFLIVNNDIRNENNIFFKSLKKYSEEKLYWGGPFLRLPRSVEKAGFADYRAYKYKRKVVDHQYHLGVDLASLKNADIEAGNSGKVIFTGNVGIYGNTIVIDHGFSILSIYSHCSEIFSQVGEFVRKGDIIGKTGISGLTGGDHLHFGIIIYDVFVNPKEWLEKNWVKNRIEAKFKYVQSKYDK